MESGFAYEYKKEEGREEDIREREQLLSRQEYSPPSGSPGERREEERQLNLITPLVENVFLKSAEHEANLKIFSGGDKTPA